MSICPPAPTLATTALAMVSPGAKLMLDASGRVVPEGNTVSHPPAEGSVMVTFSRTAVTPVPGTPPGPVTTSDSVPFGPTALPERVSATRAGTSGWYGTPSGPPATPNQPSM